MSLEKRKLLRHLTRELGELTAVFLSGDAQLSEGEAPFEVLLAVNSAAAIIAIWNQQPCLFPALQRIYVATHTFSKLTDQHTLTFLPLPPLPGARVNHWYEHMFAFSFFIGL